MLVEVRQAMSWSHSYLLEERGAWPLWRGDPLKIAFSKSPTTKIISSTTLKIETIIYCSSKDEYTISN